MLQPVEQVPQPITGKKGSFLPPVIKPLRLSPGADGGKGWEELGGQPVDWRLP
jgi:hypothetical protein